MPKYYEEDFEQDWETVIISKNNKDTQERKNDDIPFHKKIVNARQKSKITQHEFAQALNMKLSIIEKMENGLEIPDKKIITKMNKILSFKIPYQ